MILEQIFVCIDDCEVDKTPISALVFMLFYAVFLVWVFFEDERYLFLFFSSQLMLKVLSACEPRNKLVHNHAVETLSVLLHPVPTF